MISNFEGDGRIYLALQRLGQIVVFVRGLDPGIIDDYLCHAFLYNWQDQRRSLTYGPGADQQLVPGIGVHQGGLSADDSVFFAFDDLYAPTEPDWYYLRFQISIRRIDHTEVLQEHLSGFFLVRAPAVQINGHTNGINGYHSDDHHSDEHQSDGGGASRGGSSGYVSDSSSGLFIASGPRQGSSGSYSAPGTQSGSGYGTSAYGGAYTSAGSTSSGAYTSGGSTSRGAYTSGGSSSGGYGGRSNRSGTYNYAPYDYERER